MSDNVGTNAAIPDYREPYFIPRNDSADVSGDIIIRQQRYYRDDKYGWMERNLLGSMQVDLDVAALLDEIERLNAELKQVANERVLAEWEEARRG